MATSGDSIITDAELTIINDWDGEYEDWMRYVGPRVREVWNSLPPDLRRRIIDDACDTATEAWSNGIDAMGDDA